MAIRTGLQSRSACSVSSSALRTSAVRPVVSPARPFVHSRLSDCSQLRSRSRLVTCNGLFGLGLPEIAVIAGIAALVFGPSKLPEIGKGLGQTFKSFQTAAKEFETELKSAAAPDEDEAAKKKAEEEKKV